tara:strand:+ start:193 stop:342 length:150 start_codon:yes stop_codon:yes gene_type:complete
MINPSNQQSSIERDRKRDPNLAYENKISKQQCWNWPLAQKIVAYFFLSK